MSKPASMTSAIEALCDRIRAVRGASALSQAAFAERLGVSSSYLSEIEVNKGKPSIEMLTGIAREFPHVDLRWLLCGCPVPAEDRAPSLSDRYLEVRSALVNRGTTFNRLCNTLQVSRSYATRCLRGRHCGVRSDRLRRKLLEAAGVTQ